MKRYGNRPAIFYMTFTLGEEYWVKWGRKWVLCRFIKVTRKGFNLLNLETHKCLVRHHLYGRGLAGKPIPVHYTTFTCAVPECYRIMRFEQLERKTS